MINITSENVVLVGALLLFVAYGLERRQNRAFWMAVILLLLGIAGALLKGLSFLAAGAALVVLITVWLSRRRFYRSSFFWEEAIPAHWLVLAFAALGLAMGLGCGQIVLTVAVIAILVTAPLGAFAIDFSYKKLLTKETR